MNPIPEHLKHWSLDEVAECLEGLSQETYSELWEMLELAEHKKPLGGDGSNGTTEEPLITEGEYDSDLAAAWPKLSAESRLNIAQAAERLKD